MVAPMSNDLCLTVFPRRENKFMARLSLLQGHSSGPICTFGAYSRLNQHAF